MEVRGYYMMTSGKLLKLKSASVTFSCAGDDAHLMDCAQAGAGAAHKDRHFINR